MMLYKKVERDSIRRLIGADGVQIVDAESGSDALKHLQMSSFDCMILDLKLPDMTGFDLLKKMLQVLLNLFQLSVSVVSVN